MVGLRRSLVATLLISTFISVHADEEDGIGGLFARRHRLSNHRRDINKREGNEDRDLKTFLGRPKTPKNQPSDEHNDDWGNGGDGDDECTCEEEEPHKKEKKAKRPKRSWVEEVNDYPILDENGEESNVELVNELGKRDLKKKKKGKDDTNDDGGSGTTDSSKGNKHQSSGKSDEKESTKSGKSKSSKSSKKGKSTKSGKKCKCPSSPPTSKPTHDMKTTTTSTTTQYTTTLASTTAGTVSDIEILLNLYHSRISHFVLLFV